MAAGEAVLPDTPAVRRLDDLAGALQILIRFHDREVDSELIAELQNFRIAEGLPDLFQSAGGRTAAAALAAALDGIGPAPDTARLDALAAEYADIYLTHGYRVAPSGSVWMTEDRLERQQPMFEARDWYGHYGITVPNWRVRADDHLVHELEFVALLCRRGAAVPTADAARFLDQQVLPWVPEFCRGARKHATEPFYAAVMDLTRACLEELRTALEQVTGRERGIRPLPSTVAGGQADADAGPYIPGAGESW